MAVNELLATMQAGKKVIICKHYKENNPIFPSEMHSSEYIFSYTDKDKKCTYIIDGEDAEINKGAVAHLINSDVSIGEEDIPVRMTFNAANKYLEARANFEWDSSK